MPKSGKKARDRFTYGDYCTWPEEERWELIDGVPYDLTPAPARLHFQISRALFLHLAEFFAGKTCEAIYAPFDVRLPVFGEADDLVETVVQPDLLVVCDPGKLDEKGCRGAPDLVIEILSPSTASKDCIKKRALYERVGVKEFWIVDPERRSIDIMSHDSTGKFAPPIMFESDQTVSSPLFPGLAIRLGNVFPPKPTGLRESPKAYLARSARPDSPTPRSKKARAARSGD